MYIHIYIYTPFCNNIYICADLYTYTHTYVFRCVSASTHHSVYRPVYRGTDLPTYLPSYLPTYLPIYLPTYLPIYLSVRLSIHLSNVSAYTCIWHDTRTSTNMYISIHMYTHRYVQKHGGTFACQCVLAGLLAELACYMDMLGTGWLIANLWLGVLCCALVAVGFWIPATNQESRALRERVSGIPSRLSLNDQMKDTIQGNLRHTNAIPKRHADHHQFTVIWSLRYGASIDDS